MRACVSMAVMLLIVAGCEGTLVAATEPSEPRVEVARACASGGRFAPDP